VLYRILFVLLLLPLSPVRAQIDDTGLWLGADLRKSVTRKLDVTLGEQVRMHQDITAVDALITDAGIQYDLTKKLRASLNYRFINSNQENYYSKRHRFYADVSWKEKFSRFSVSLRERIQEQFNDYYSSERGKIPTWTLRSKLDVKVDLDRKYAPYASVEIYQLVDDARERERGITRYRYEAGFEYEFNRRYSLNPYVIFQRDRSPAWVQLIYGLEYKIAI
jgi:hypothetical protein